MNNIRPFFIHLPESKKLTHNCHTFPESVKKV